MNRLYPLFLKLSGHKCLVVGGGPVALQKTRQLADCEASVTVVSPEVAPELLQLIDAGAVQWLRRTYQTGDLDGVFLVIGATDDRTVQEQIAAEAGVAGVLCNIVDVPDLCDFYVPSIVTQGHLKIAVSTNGASPALAHRIRTELEEQFGPEYGEFLEFLARMRSVAKSRFPESPQQRQAFLEAIVASPALEYLKHNQREAYEKLIGPWIS